jgi:hypothetical protein
MPGAVVTPPAVVRLLTSSGSPSSWCLALGCVAVLCLHGQSIAHSCARRFDAAVSFIVATAISLLEDFVTLRALAPLVVIVVMEFVRSSAILHSLRCCSSIKVGDGAAEVVRVNAKAKGATVTGCFFVNLSQGVLRFAMLVSSRCVKHQKNPQCTVRHTAREW